MTESHAGPRTTCCIDGYTNEDRTEYCCDKHRHQRSETCCYPCTEQNKPQVDCMFCRLSTAPCEENPDRCVGAVRPTQEPRADSRMVTHWQGCWREHSECAQTCLDMLIAGLTSTRPPQDLLHDIYNLLKP